jgi:hypothetical protein
MKKPRYVLVTLEHTVEEQNRINIEIDILVFIPYWEATWEETVDLLYLILKTFPIQDQS